MKPYADSNFFTRLYLRGEFFMETTERAKEAIEAGQRLPVLWLHRMEVRNAIELSVFLWTSGKPGRVTAETAASTQAQFREDCTAVNGLLVQTALPLDELEGQFQDLSLRHTARHGFRTYDLLHVSAALLLGCDTFWSYDAKCSKLAGLEGLQTLKTSH